MGATARTVDLTNVKDQSGINKNRIPAGDYAAIIKRVEDAEAKDKTPQYFFFIQIKDRPSSVLPYYCKLQENQLWKLRNIFIAAGKTVPKKKMKVDPNTIVGKLIGVTVDDTEYDGKEQSEITGVFPASELDSSVNVASDSEDEDDDEPTITSAADDDDDDDDVADEPEEDEAEEAEEPEDEAEEDDEPADPYADLDRAELKKRVKKLDPEFKVFTKTTDDDLKAALAKLEAAAAKPAAKAKSKAPVADEDLDDIDIDDL
jgi:hypothetical protein